MKEHPGWIQHYLHERLNLSESNSICLNFNRFVGDLYTLCCGVYPCPGTHTNSPVQSSSLSRSGIGRCYRSSPRGWRMVQPSTTIVKGGDCSQVWCQPPAPPPLFCWSIIYDIVSCNSPVLNLSNIIPPYTSPILSFHDPVQQCIFPCKYIVQACMCRYV